MTEGGRKCSSNTTTKTHLDINFNGRRKVSNFIHFKSSPREDEIFHCDFILRNFSMTFKHSESDFSEGDETDGISATINRLQTVSMTRHGFLWVAQPIQQTAVCYVMWSSASPTVLQQQRLKANISVTCDYFTHGFEHNEEKNRIDELVKLLGNCRSRYSQQVLTKF